MYATGMSPKAVALKGLAEDYIKHTRQSAYTQSLIKISYYLRYRVERILPIKREGG
jgi:hypothetical protein